MLDETISLSFSDDGVVAATAKVFKKRAHEVDSAIYRYNDVIADPSKPDFRISLGVTDPKATNNFYGTRRATVNIRHDREVPIPGGGTGKFPVVFKIEASIPVGVPLANMEYDFGALRAFINSDICKRLTLTQET